MSEDLEYERRKSGKEDASRTTNDGSQMDPSRSNRLEPYRDPLGVPRRIHISGLGSVGKFIAHALRNLPSPPPVTLILHKSSMVKDWNASTKGIRVTTNGTSIGSFGFDIELVHAPYRIHGKEVRPGEPMLQGPSRVPRGHQSISSRNHKPGDSDDLSEVLNDNKNNGDISSPVPAFDGGEFGDGLSSGEYQSREPIHSLILCCKASQVVSALLPLRQRLSTKSTIVFVQNGMGVLDEVNKHVFPDAQTRPHYMLAINSHGTTSSGPLTVRHAGAGVIALGLMPHEAFPPSHTAQPHADSSNPLALPHTVLWPSTARYLLRTLTRSPILVAAGYPPPELLQSQLDKLAVNAIINPLTALLDSRNDSILNSDPLSRAMRLLLAEVSTVILSLPELRGVPNVQTRFSTARLEALVVRVATQTGENISSTLADVRAGRRTEIDFVNGWIVKRGEQLGIRCVMNYLIMQLVKGKAGMIQWERMGEEVPYWSASSGKEWGIKFG